MVDCVLARVLRQHSDGCGRNGAAQLLLRRHCSVTWLSATAAARVRHPQLLYELTLYVISAASVQSACKFITFGGGC
jgi:hypothetical protein